MRIEALYARLVDEAMGIEGQASRQRFAWLVVCRTILAGFLSGRSGRSGSGGRETSESPSKRRTQSLYRSSVLPVLGETCDGAAPVHDSRQREIAAVCTKVFGTSLGDAFPSADIPDELSEALLDLIFRGHWQLNGVPAESANDAASGNGAVTADAIESLLGRVVDRKKLGAYYTAADVTRYMASRTIVPWLLRRVESVYPAAKRDWSKLLRDDLDRYLPPPLRHGANAELPPNVACGLADVSRRSRWNEFAQLDVALVGETWREVAARRARLQIFQMRLRSREPLVVDEQISLNVDVERLALDWIASRGEPARAAVRTAVGGVDGDGIGGGRVDGPLAVLDSTCGGGAFLVAALRVLEPLCTACDIATRGEAVAAVLRDNLHGVDLLPEAVDATRMRLALEWIARMPPGALLDLLPDLTQTIRCGNALLGDAQSCSLPLIASRDSVTGPEAPNSNGSAAKHPPFHWPQEFPQVMRRGGFDVVIGNPPYVEYTRAGVEYPLPGEWRTRRCNNLHALVAERCAELSRPDAAFAFIVPAASVATPRMAPLVELLLERFRGVWISLYDERPGKLFPGVDQQLAILLGHDAGPCRALCTTPMRHWWTRPHDERRHLFGTLSYQPLPPGLRAAGVIPKIGTPLELELLDKLASIEPLPWRCGEDLPGAATVYYKNAGGRYWRLVKSFATRYRSQRGAAATSTEMTLRVRPDLLPAVVCCFSSSLFYWYWRVVSNCRHLTERELAAFPLPPSLAGPQAIPQFRKLWRRYERRLKQTLSLKLTNNARSGRILQDEFRVSAAKGILDEIDRALGPHYGLSGEQLDLVINYDLKYRMAGRRSPATTPPGPAPSPRSPAAPALRGSPAG